MVNAVERGEREEREQRWPSDWLFVLMGYASTARGKIQIE